MVRRALVRRNPRSPTVSAFLPSNRCDMLEIMYVRCTHCGYDNSPEYRFCGMCGASLAHPPIVTKPPVREVVTPSDKAPSVSEKDDTVRGPSFLGLADDPKSEFHYLYEDEPPRSHFGLIVVLLFIAGLGGATYWQWSHNGFPFNRISAAGAPLSTDTAPSQAQSQQTPTQPPITSANQASPASTENAVPAAQASSENSASESAAETAPPHPEPRKQEVAKVTPPPKVAPKAYEEASKRTPAAKPKPAPPPVARTPVVRDADLEAAGERYLYGTGGVAQNCSHAESNLRVAAAHGNLKAQAVLGTMYYTGHCVARDLPAAYRWFARALHQDPQNSTLSADLQVLWRQMSTEERQLAINSEP
jgi:zinc-ribbon domain/Sel1 repeat